MRHLEILLRLLPPVAYQAGDPAIARELAPTAEAFDAVLDARAAAQAEIDPRTTLQLLPDFEALYGLPGPCVIADEQTVAVRRNAVQQAMAATGGQALDYFVAVAAALGFEVTINELQPHTVDDPVDEPIWDQSAASYWEVHTTEYTVTYATADSPCDEPLATWGNDLLECTLRRLRPAHTVVLFRYD